MAANIAAAQAAGGPPQPPNPPTIPPGGQQFQGNVLKVILKGVQVGGLWTYARGQEHLGGTIQGAILTMVFQLVLAIIGIIISWVGFLIDWTLLIQVGRVIAAFAAFFGGAILIMTWVRVELFGEIALLVSRVFGSTAEVVISPFPGETPDIEILDSETKKRVLMAITSGLAAETAIVSWATHVPVFTHMALFLTCVSIGYFLVFAGIAWPPGDFWLKFIQKSLVVIGVVFLVLATVAFINPNARGLFGGDYMIQIKIHRIIQDLEAQELELLSGMSRKSPARQAADAAKIREIETQIHNWASGKMYESPEAWHWSDLGKGQNLVKLGYYTLWALLFGLIAVGVKNLFGSQHKPGLQILASLLPVVMILGGAPLLRFGLAHAGTEGRTAQPAPSKPQPNVPPPASGESRLATPPLSCTKTAGRTDEWDLVVNAPEQFDSEKFGDQGIHLYPDDKVFLTDGIGLVNASATINDGAFGVVDFEGWPNNPPFNTGRKGPLPQDKPFMGLAVRVGQGSLSVDDEQWLFVGKAKSFQVTQEGFLHLVFNDKAKDEKGISHPEWMANNNGGGNIHVKVARAAKTQP